MKFVVLGPTGATGRLVVDQAVSAGHEVVAYARRPQAVRAETGVTVVGGSIDDVAALAQAMTGADAVISCLGPKLSLQMLFSVDVLQRAVLAVVAAMRRTGVRHFVVMSAFGVADTGRSASLPARLAFGTLVRASYVDKERAERELISSGVGMTIVYPAMLTNGPATGAPTVVPVADLGGIPGMPTVSRADVAAVLVDLATHPEDSVGKRLYIG